MDYEYNRKAFRAFRNAQSTEILPHVYLSCILLELALKQYLGLVKHTGNGGHNLPRLLQQLSIRHPRQKIVCDALMISLGNCLSSLYCQGKSGQPQRVPASSYPHLRYIRHTSDWQTEASTDDEIRNLKGIVDRIVNHLSKSVNISL